MAWALASLNQDRQIVVPRSSFPFIDCLNDRSHTNFSAMKHHAGQIVKQYFDSLPRSYTVAWLARQLHCDRTNIYHIFQRQSIDSLTLARLSMILRHNFFDDIASEIDKSMGDESPRDNLSEDYSGIPT